MLCFVNQHIEVLYNYTVCSITFAHLWLYMFMLCVRMGVIEYFVFVCIREFAPKKRKKKETNKHVDKQKSGTLRLMIPVNKE